MYERILCENIINAINNKNNRLILGRTANEFKSNFGAVPKKSYIYININNKSLEGKIMYKNILSIIVVGSFLLFNTSISANSEKIESDGTVGEFNYFTVTDPSSFMKALNDFDKSECAKSWRNESTCIYWC